MSPSRVESEVPVAVVTGGSRGIGAECARVLHADGMRVVIADVLEGKGQALADELGAGAVFNHLDVADESSWKKLVRGVISTLGAVDILVNNAGVANMSSVEDFTIAKWNAVLSVNLTGAFLGCRAVVPGMKQRGSGSIVNISSVDGMRGSPGVHAYTASKWGVRGLTKSLAVELGPHGIRVNSVHPGYVPTRMTSRMDPDRLDIPLGRGGTATEVAATVAFLASEASSFTTGAEFVVDGGMIAGIPRR
ncbi:SDR family oxidoreductase [Ruania alkalisoli]|uniref:SDR family oxidoreductase n=2 Tax=Ruania alkalisoli TaxID=2779775 RepID=A0A7M1SS92_9MICO|nr:SDR family oxidoreductase [Ruania alkalisoli]QOR69864.1 SDR family oxidoreductase [Ruania alkalisoli]